MWKILFSILLSVVVFVFTGITLDIQVIFKTPCLALYKSKNTKQNTNLAPRGGPANADLQHVGRFPGALAKGATSWALVLETDYKSHFPVVIL